ncbi:MAG: nitrous oxide-stimulated promoter family protein [Phycisphaeraceae bacterium JB051]
MSIKQQQQSIRAMIRLFCRHHHGKHDPLCDDCQNLQDYAIIRLSRCRYGDDKPSCRQCVTHCYQKQMRQQMIKVMRYAGPRMMLYHPIMAVQHLWTEWRSEPKASVPEKKSCQVSTCCNEASQKK